MMNFMIRKVSGLFLAVLIALGPAVPGAALAEGLDSASRVKLYESQKKDPWIAAGLAFIVPTAGHAYDGDWTRGLLFLIPEGAALALTIYGSTGSRASGGSPGAAGLIGVGLLSVVKVWETIDAAQTADAVNRQLRKQYRLETGFRDGCPVVAVHILLP